MTTGDEQLAEALRAEHAAIFGYGAIGAKLDKATAQFALQAEEEHRERRDALLLRLSQRGGTPPAADPVYTLPVAVTDQASALQLAVTIEERVAARWRSVLPQAAGEDRTMALDALIGSAVLATQARRHAGISPATVPFPGAPA
ncbi:MAG: ferritin-like domain-containing protein [Dactylosporangium sp.]|nr:ferritin-like domain-containing protein [Dactylosporangium sp.]NNJ59959.1 ferritin-like domain-containing protein [Dactylosporangium sp.]